MRVQLRREAVQGHVQRSAVDMTDDADVEKRFGYFTRFADGSKTDGLSAYSFLLVVKQLNSATLGSAYWRRVGLIDDGV